MSATREPNVDDDNLGLLDEEFWAPTDTKFDVFGPKLVAARFSGVRIGAPTLVDATARTSMPILLCQVERSRRLELLDLGRRAVVTAVDLDAGVTVAGLAFGGDDATPPPTLPVPADCADLPVLEGRETLARKLDAREVLGLPLHDGAEYLITVLMLDKATNRRRVRVVAPDRPSDPAARALAHAERLAKGPPPVRPAPRQGHLFPAYARQPSSPPIPETAGVSIAVPRVTVMGAGLRTLPAYGAFRLPLAPHHIIPARWLAVRDVAPGDEAPYSAAIPLTLVSTGSVTPGPRVISMNVPTSDRIDPAHPPETVTGYFAIDLLATGLPREPQTHFIYAFSGEVLSGPTLTALIAPEALLSV